QLPEPRRLLLLFAVLATALFASAQRQTWYLDQDYGLKPNVDKARTLQEAGLTTQQAQAKYPRFWARWQAKGGNAQSFMRCGTFTAAYLDAYYQGQAHNLATTTGASGNIVIPRGEHWTTSVLYLPIGTVEGNGTFAHGADMGSTVISLWHERWNPEPGDDPTIRDCFRTAVCGVGGSLGYAESVVVTNIRLEGRKTSVWHDP